jgi:hypothetical protein
LEAVEEEVMDEGGDDVDGDVTELGGTVTDVVDDVLDETEGVDGVVARTYSVDVVPHSKDEYV